MSALTVFRDAWQNRDQLGDDNKSRELAAFLPAALEIQQAPPNPIAKWLGRSLMILLSIGVIWACVGQVNVVASAEGKIIPSSRVKQIQPLEKAIVKRILVSEGQSVSKGQALIELDSTITRADQKRLQAELGSAQLNWSVSRALLKILDLPLSRQKKLNNKSVVLEQVDSINKADVELHRRLVWQQWQQYQTQRQSLQSAHRKNQAEQSASEQTIIKLDQTLPLITRRAGKAQSLYAQGYLPETDYLLLEEERIRQAQDLEIEKQRLKQLLAMEQDILQQIKTLTAQAKASQLTNLAEMQRQIVALQEELSKAVDLNARRVLYSPVSGQVQALAVNTVGGVVTDAQVLMLVVPDEEQLEVEVFLENKDIGFVHEDLPAEIKVHTFPFTKYGIIDAQITSISDDATVDEKRGLIYGMQLLLSRNTIDVDGRRVKLMPGMAVTAEMQTGERRIIEFFLAPLLRARAESIRER
ncbi:MAG: HlyD family type I secretion periplasmic adaptor subunit [Gammaproteobacteria bacterium]|nr:HlyD family type I secretion periplasmic adaptor subunit [Gammaproteobacteria bacterium]